MAVGVHESIPAIGRSCPAPLVPPLLSRPWIAASASIRIGEWSDEPRQEVDAMHRVARSQVGRSTRWIRSKRRRKARAFTAATPRISPLIMCPRRDSSRSPDPPTSSPYHAATNAMAGRPWTMNTSGSASAAASKLEMTQPQRPSAIPRCELWNAQMHRASDAR